MYCRNGTLNFYEYLSKVDETDVKIILKFADETIPCKYCCISLYAEMHDPEFKKFCQAAFISFRNNQRILEWYLFYRPTLMQFKLTFDIISPFVDKLNPFVAFKAQLKY